MYARIYKRFIFVSLACDSFEFFVIQIAYNVQ